MAFVAGKCANPNGRPVGSKNKARFEVAEILKRVDCNPFELLADLAKTARSEKVRCEAAAELAQYVAPKLKSVEISTDPDNPVKVNMYFGHGN